MTAALVILIAAVVGALLLAARIHADHRARRRAAAEALRAASEDYTINLGLMTPWQVRQWLRNRAGGAS
jgi:hypothetical protein